MMQNATSYDSLGNIVGTHMVVPEPTSQDAELGGSELGYDNDQELRSVLAVAGISH